MQAMASEALPPESNPKRGNKKTRNKFDINLCKSAKAKKQCHSLPYSVLRVRNDQCKHFKCGFTSDSNPKRVKKEVKKLAFIYVEEPKLKSLTYRTLGFPEYGLTNPRTLRVALPLTATPKGVTKGGGVKKLTCIYVNRAMLKPLSYRTLVFPSTE